MTSTPNQTLLKLALDLCLWDRPDCFSVDLCGNLYLLGLHVPSAVVSSLDKEARSELVRAFDDYSESIQAALLDDPEDENKAA